MKNIRIISLVLAVLMIAFAMASCGGNTGGTTTTTPTTTTTTTTQPPQKETLNVFDSYDEVFAEGFDKMTEGVLSVENGKIKIDNTVACYHVKDTELVLNADNYTMLIIDFDMKFDSLPKSGNISVVSPLFWVDEALQSQFFLKVDAYGNLSYHAQGKWAQPILIDGAPATIQTGKYYNVRVEYDIAYGSYAIFLDDVQIEDDILEWIMDEDVSSFTVRFMDANASNGAYSVTLDNVTIVAEP